MKKAILVTIVLCAPMLAPPAQAEDLMNACMRVVEAEGQPEGIAGCQCLVEEVGDDQKMSQTLLDLAELDAEQRIMTKRISDVVGKCFALSEEEENEQI